MDGDEAPERKYFARQPPPRRLAWPWRAALIALALAATLASAALAMRAGRALINAEEHLSFCVPRAGVEADFAGRLARVAAAHAALLRVVLHPVEDPIAGFGRRECDLAVIRSDVKPPSWARSLAILETDLVLLVAHKGSEPDKPADLRKGAIVLAMPGPRDEALLRAILAAYGFSANDRHIVLPGDAAGVAKQFAASKANVIFAVAPRSRMVQGDLLHFLGPLNGIAFADLPEAAALAKRLRGLAEETAEKGLFSSAPPLPADDLSTVSLDVRLAARSSLRESAAAQLTRLIFENKEDLAIPGQFAEAIAPPDTDKDAQMLAHPGAAQYVNDDEKSFFDRYGDYFYLGAPAASVVGSVFLWMLSRLIRSAPPRPAGELAEDILLVAEEARAAADLPQLEAADERLDQILRDALRDLRDGRLSSEGLEVFRLAYEQTREWIRNRRHALEAGAPKGGTLL